MEKKKPKTIGTFWMLYYIFVLDYESIINSRKTGKKNLFSSNSSDPHIVFMSIMRELLTCSISIMKQNKD